MSAFLFRLGRMCARHPFRVMGLWLVAAVAIVTVQNTAGGTFNDSFRVPGVESQRALDVLKNQFPSQAGQTTRIVVHVDDGRLDDTGHKLTVEQVRKQLLQGRNVASVTDPFAAQSAAISADGQTGYLDVAYTLDKLKTQQLTDATAAALRARADGVQTEFTGLLAQLAKNDPASELIGVGAHYSSLKQA